MDRCGLCLSYCFKLYYLNDLLPYLLVIAATVAFYFILKWDVNADFKKWKDEKAVDHEKESWYRVLLVFPGLGYMFAHPLAWYWAGLIVAVMLLFAWLLFFNGWYNRKRNKEFFYVGSDEKEPGWHSKDSWTENFLQRMEKINDSLPMIIQVGGFAFTTGIYVFSFLKFRQ